MDLRTHCNIGSKRAFPTSVLDKWHNCLLIYWRSSFLVPAFDDTYSVMCLRLSDASVRGCLVFWYAFWMICKQSHCHAVIERWVICNHWWVMAVWSRKTWNFVEYFLRFFGKTTPYGKIFKILFRKFSPRHRSTLCLNLVKCCRRSIGEIVRYLPDKNEISATSQTVATARIVHKIC